MRKHIRHFFELLLLLAVAAVFINAKTRFFKDISENVPYLAEHYPYAAEYIEDLSDTVNEAIAHIPTIPELIAAIQGTDVPISAEDVAKNMYYSSNSTLSFYSDCNISVRITDDNRLDIYGVTPRASEKYHVYRFESADGEVLKQHTGSTNDDGSYRSMLHIPDGTYQFTIFTGGDRFGEYVSSVLNYIYLEQQENGDWIIETSPVYEHNVQMFEKPKSKKKALENTYDICSSESSVEALALSITRGYTSDYDKALAIHDWVCGSIYYDEDSINGDYNTAPYVASDVLKEQRAVCLGYANLYAALCRAVNIPCNVVTGYALGVSDDSDRKWNDTNTNNKTANHAWNEVYLNEHWVLIDTTWDSRNKIHNGEKTKGDVSYLYFDANLLFFSNNHKIHDYSR